MKHRFLIIALLTTLVSCGSMLTENENKAIDEVLEFFGGYCKYSVGVSASTEEGEKKYFELELSQSNSLTKFKDNKEIVTSKLSYIFFCKLSEKEKENYTHIRGTLLYDNGEKFSKDYSIEELETVKNKLLIVDKVVSLIKNKNFIELKDLLNDQESFRYDKNELVTNIEKVEPEFGNIKEYRLFGFKFSYAGDNEILKIYGVVLRDKNNHELSIYLDPNSKKEEILKLDYEL
ncbi:hypothetical protein SAMN04488109_0486 [Chryseolinea serpens]|uniref:Lipoprotein n=1 Tax=Chryseolinea serpens TaxID=947013 RepID=A0A1M5K7W2_9BACT|nr:hypothetical protein [Chryseolinea serpens]SHG48771.1 hypothetical protein SAMN04488109_0486 [Chryseolinea serpens]